MTQEALVVKHENPLPPQGEREELLRAAQEKDWEWARKLEPTKRNIRPGREYLGRVNSRGQVR